MVSSWERGNRRRHRRVAAQRSCLVSRRFNRKVLLHTRAIV